jgi:signal transduction histidine kinase
VDVDTSGDPGDVDRTQATALFRMFQEVLTNAGRHAGCKLVTVRLDAEEDSVLLTVHDDGRGITPEEIGDPNALGLLGLRERARLHGGRFRIAPADEGGTMVRIGLPRQMPTGGRPA